MDKREIAWAKECIEILDERQNKLGEVSDRQAGTIKELRGILDPLLRIIGIVKIIGLYISLKKVGKTGKYKARCPFHDEKTASFIVDPGQQLWHCFGCGVGGDVILFLNMFELREKGK